MIGTDSLLVRSSSTLLSLPEAKIVMPPTSGASAQLVLDELARNLSQVKRGWVDPWYSHEQRSQPHAGTANRMVISVRRAAPVSAGGCGGYELDIAGFERTTMPEGTGCASRLTIEIDPVSADGTAGRSRHGRCDAYLPSQEAPPMRAIGWTPSARTALLFIHGWTEGHKNAHHVLGQLLNLTRADQGFIKPFIFAWPCGDSKLSFPQAVRFASTNIKVHRALAEVVASLAAAGVQHLHVIGHSMGCRLFCSALPVVAEHLVSLKDSRRYQRRSIVEARMELATVTLLHPEHDLRTFITRDYDILREYCEHITIYLDQHDNALMLAEVINRQPSLGKHPYALVRREDTRGARGSATDEFSISEFSLRRPLTYLRGYEHPNELKVRASDVHVPLDVDVVDTSWMDTNTAGPRHAYFNVNRWIIDDLAEVISTRRRADDRRHRLIKLDHGAAHHDEDETHYMRGHITVFVFLAAPSWVGS